jgi:hypothetical protein
VTHSNKGSSTTEVGFAGSQGVKLFAKHVRSLALEGSGWRLALWDARRRCCGKF